VDLTNSICPSQWVLKPENSLAWHKEVLDWINKHVGLDDTGLEGGIDKVGV
jgi:hypothetical protein